MAKRHSHFWDYELLASLGLIGLGHALKQESRRATSRRSMRTVPPLSDPARISPLTSFSDGMYWVAKDGDVLPGLYRARGVPGTPIYWERRANARADDSPIANFFGPCQQVYVEIREGEFFRSEGSGGWYWVRSLAPSDARGDVNTQ
jgi:hypothetical protein